MPQLPGKRKAPIATLWWSPSLAASSSVIPSLCYLSRPDLTIEENFLTFPSLVTEWLTVNRFRSESFDSKPTREWVSGQLKTLVIHSFETKISGSGPACRTFVQYIGTNWAPNGLNRLEIQVHTMLVLLSFRGQSLEVLHRLHSMKHCC